MSLRIAVPDEDFAQRLADLDHDCVVWGLDDTATLPAIDALVTERPRERASWRRLTDLPDLRLLQLLSLGYDWVDEFRSERFAVANARGYVEHFTSELAVSLLIGGFRRYDLVARNSAAHRWEQPKVGAIWGSRILLAGYGGVAKTIEPYLRLAGAREIIRVARTARTTPEGVRIESFDRLGELVADVDAVVSTLPLTNETEGAFDARVFAAMTPGTVFVNVGRGRVVDTDALLEVLPTGRIVAMLDVVDPEPLPADHPLWTMPNCVITPHYGGDVAKSRTALAQLVKDQLASFAETGEVLNRV